MPDLKRNNKVAQISEMMEAEDLFHKAADQIYRSTSSEPDFGTGMAMLILKICSQREYKCIPVSLKIAVNNSAQLITAC